MLGKTRAIMNGAGFDEKKRHLFWTEAANTVTHLENIMIRKGMARTPHYLFYGSAHLMHNIYKYLENWQLLKC